MKTCNDKESKNPESIPLTGSASIVNRICSGLTLILHSSFVVILLTNQQASQQTNIIDKCENKILKIYYRCYICIKITVK